MKDAIDVAGVPTTAGSRAVASSASPATADAACLAGTRAAGARIVGKTNLHELCFGTSGVNPAFGTPVNPAAPDLVPGGSSSGSAVAVAVDDADVAFGTDTGGSVRIPAACCGVVGLKTSFGRVSLDGVWPLAPSFDTVGPLAATVAGVIRGMDLLEPGFSTAMVEPAAAVVRVRPAGVAVDRDFDDAVDAALHAAGLEVVDRVVDGWVTARAALLTLLAAEAWRSDGHLVDTGLVAEPVRSRLLAAAAVSASDVTAARDEQRRWAASMAELFEVAPVLALPTLVRPPDPVAMEEPTVPNVLCAPVNLAGAPALSLPVPGRPGCAVQLVARPGDDATACATAAVVEVAVAAEVRRGH